LIKKHICLSYECH